MGANTAEKLDDDETEEAGEERYWKDWPEAKGAAAQLEITQQQLLQLVRQNKIHRFRGADGSWRYRPEDIERVRDKLFGVDSGHASPFGDQASIGDVLAANVALLKQAHEHIEALMKTINAPMKTGIDFLTTISQQQNEEITKLRAYTDESISTRERLLSEEEIRQLMRQSEAAKEKRKTEAWALFIKEGPRILDQLRLSIASRSPEAQAAVTLIQSLDPAFVEAFADSDMLSAEQKALLRQVLAAKKAQQAAAAAAAEKPAEPAKSEPPAPPPPAPPPPPPAEPAPTPT